MMHFTFTDRTGSNGIVGVVRSTNPMVAGVPLAAGDEIGAFTPDRVDDQGNVTTPSFCVGATLWPPSGNTAITVWGKDDLFGTPGIAPGEQIQYRVWQQSTGSEYRATVAYQQGDGIYQTNCIFVLSSLTTDSEPLPIEFAGASALVSGDSATLYWETISETNNYGFQVHRELGTEDWQLVGFVQGHGTTLERQRYQFTDRVQRPGLYLYRITQIDLDGTKSDVWESTVDLSAVQPKEEKMFDKGKRSIQDTLALLTSRTGVLVGLATAGLVLGLWLNEAWAWWVFWVCTFSAFDVYVSPTTNQDSAYRIGQFALWVALSVGLYKAGAMRALYASWVFWYFLGCEGLYLWSKHQRVEPFDYWDASIFVAYFKYIKKENTAPITAVKVSMALGLAVALVILTIG